MTNKHKLFLTGGLLTVLFLLPVCLSFGADADGQTDFEALRIGSIKVLVHKSVGQRKVLATVRVRQGQMFNAVKSEEDCSRIGKIDGVRKAYYNIEVVDGQVALTYVAVTDRFVGDIIIKGNKHIKSKKLEKELGFKKNDYLDVSRVKNGVNELVEYYHKKGYAFAAVTLDESRLGNDGVVQVVYEVKEGVRCRVKKVTFEGNEALESKKLLKVPEARTRKFLVVPVYYDSEKMAGDVAKIQEVYQKLGYLNVAVKEEVSFSENKKKAFVNFQITEGPVFSIQDVAISGSGFFTFKNLSENMRLQPGDAFGIEKVQYDLRHIKNSYLEKGFVDTKVEFKREFVPGNKVVAKFEVDSGQRYRIGMVSVVGNHEVHDKVIRSILDEDGFTPGNWYNAKLASGDGKGELEVDLRQQILAESATIEPTDSKGNIRNAQVNIVEARTGSIMFGAGVASNTGIMGNITLDQRNFDITDTPENWKEFFTGRAFKGAGQRFKISLSPGTQQSSYLVSFGDSYLYDKPISFDVSGSSFERIQESYDEGRMKGYVGFEKRYKNKWRRGFAFRAEQVDVSDIEITAPKEIKDVKGKNDLFGGKLFIRKDTTDNRFIPTKGYNFDLGYEQVGGDFTFGILGATQRWYKTLLEDLAGRKTVLETKVHMATIVGDAPPFEKFYGGGTGSIRGFDYRGVSTRGKPTNSLSTKEKDPIGSDWIVTASAEVSVPLETDALSWLFFVDTGMIDTGGVRASVGTGVQLLLPQWFGPVPMRFELAAPFMKDEGDETRVFSFSVGALF